MLTRTDENSLVLRKALGPLTAIYELSTYTLSWFCAANDFGNERYFVTGCKLFNPERTTKSDAINLEHVLLISADGIHYQEDTLDKARMRRYMREYRKEIRSASERGDPGIPARRGAGRGRPKNTGGIKTTGDSK